MGTLIILDEHVFPESKVPELLKEIDEKLLPDVSMKEGQLSFTVVAGHIVGTFLPASRLSGSALSVQVART